MLGIWVNCATNCGNFQDTLSCFEKYLFQQERLKLFINENAKRRVETTRSIYVICITGTSSWLSCRECGTQDKTLQNCAHLEVSFVFQINMSRILHGATCPEAASPLGMLNSYYMLYRKLNLVQRGSERKTIWAVPHFAR